VFLYIHFLYIWLARHQHIERDKGFTRKYWNPEASQST